MHFLCAVSLYCGFYSAPLLNLLIPMPRYLPTNKDFCHGEILVVIQNRALVVTCPLGRRSTEGRKLNRKFLEMTASADIRTLIVDLFALMYVMGM